MAKSVLISIILVLFSGCSFAGRHFAVAYGNFEFSQGRFSSALERYESAREFSLDSDFESLLDFNLGSVRYAIGDIELAVEYWTAAGDTDDADVRFRSVYNLGVLLFQQGSYRQAYENFRSALRVQPGDMEAKHNLELSFSRWQASGPSQAESRTERRDDIPSTAESLLEEIQRRNAERFRVRDEVQPRSDVNDW
ncbi:MAG: tetratricopeptide repeat protein [Spirochaetaceae bacterium]|nr:MAG: tetratricopeptide repeat protein [Spirochaetaceae bacterium]